MTIKFINLICCFLEAREIWMAKPKGINQKSATARERKADAAAEQKASNDKAKEDAKWEDKNKQLDRKNDRANEKVYSLLYL